MIFTLIFLIWITIKKTSTCIDFWHNRWAFHVRIQILIQGKNRLLETALVTTNLCIIHYIFPFLVLWLIRWYYRFLRTLFDYAFRSKMLFFKTFYNALSLSFWHVVEALVLNIFLSFICERSIFNATYRSILTSFHLYIREIHIWSFFFTILYRQNFFIFLSFIFKRADSINALLNLFFVRVNIDNMFFWMINSEPSHITQDLIIIQKHLNFSKSLNNCHNT